jgi:hypothetical protein
MSEKLICSVSVFKRFHYYQCSAKAKYQHEGRWYCGTHYPPAVAQKKAERDAKWSYEQSAMAKKAAIESAKEDVLLSARLWRRTPNGETVDALEVAIDRLAHVERGA